MLKSIFLWIYCMDFHKILLLLAIFTGLFYAAWAKFSYRRFWKAAVLITLLAWAAVVIGQTLLWREPNYSLEPIWQPLQSYIAAATQKELLRSNFMNAVLFYPAGLLFVSVLPSKWMPAAKLSVTLCVFTLLSAVIEFLQFRYCLGLAQTDDVIHNVLGAMIGAAVMIILPAVFKKPYKTALF